MLVEELPLAMGLMDNIGWQAAAAALALLQLTPARTIPHPMKLVMVALGCVPILLGYQLIMVAVVVVDLLIGQIQAPLVV